jgi:LysM repeat protein
MKKRSYTLKWYFILGLLGACFPGQAQQPGHVAGMELANDTQDGDPANMGNRSDEYYGPVFYQVKKGETIASIASQFHLRTEQFNKWNFLPQGIKPGMKVAVRFDWQKKQENKPETETQTAAKAIQYHRVAPKETLYHLSVLHGVTVEQLKEWNHLQDNKIAVNRELIVGK